MSALPGYDDWKLRAPDDDRQAFIEIPVGHWIAEDEWIDFRNAGIRDSLECLTPCEIKADYFDDAVQLSLAMLPPEPCAKFHLYVNTDVSLDMRAEVLSMLLDAVA